MTQTISATLPASTVYVSGTVNDVSVVWTNTGGSVWEAVADRSDDDAYHVVLTIVNAAGTSSTAEFTLYYGLLNLITDRTQSDVSYVARLAAKGWSGMTEDERSQWLIGLKGAYNATDLNRVGNAVTYVAGRLEEAGYAPDIDPKIDWTIPDIPTKSQMETYLDNVRALRNAFTVPDSVPQVPADMEGLTYQEANDIERIILAIDALITNIINAYFYSNEVYSGEV